MHTSEVPVVAWKYNKNRNIISISSNDDDTNAMIAYGPVLNSVIHKDAEPGKNNAFHKLTSMHRMVLLHSTIN